MNPLYSCESLSDILAAAFDVRKSRNGSYSLRAFARDLDVSASRLSELMKGGHGLSGAMATKLANNLKLRPQEKKFFLDTILSQSARNQRVRSLAKKRIESARKSKLLLQIQDEQFKVIADWQHGAILELTQVAGFKQNTEWISQFLGISEDLVRESIARLKKLGLIQTRSDGTWEVHSDAYQTFSKSSLAVRKFHQQILEMAEDSITNDHANERECQAMIFAIPKKDLPKFSEKMRDFLRDCWEDISDTPKDSLYSFSVQLTPVGAKRKETEK